MVIPFTRIYSHLSVLCTRRRVTVTSTVDGYLAYARCILVLGLILLVSLVLISRSITHVTRTRVGY